MKNVAAKFKNKPFATLLVNLGETEEAVAAFLKSNDYSFTVLLDHEGTVSRDYQVVGIPSAFLIDKRGRIIFGTTGYHDWDNEELHKLINLLIDK